MTSPALLEARGLALERGRRRIVTDLAFSAPAGTLVRLDGANGSGKTTTLRALAGLVPVAAGEILWRGEAHLETPAYHKNLNYVGHRPALSAELTAAENLAFFAALRQAPLRIPIDAALERFAVAGVATRPVRTLSAGQRQRVALARLLLFDCALWMLDEPFTALDGAGRVLLERALDEQLERGGAVILATHQGLSVDHPVTTVELGLPAEEAVA